MLLHLTMGQVLLMVSKPSQEQKELAAKQRTARTSWNPLAHLHLPLTHLTTTNRALWLLLYFHLADLVQVSLGQLSHRTIKEI